MWNGKTWFATHVVPGTLHDHVCYYSSAACLGESNPISFHCLFKASLSQDVPVHYPVACTNTAPFTCWWMCMCPGSQSLPVTKVPFLFTLSARVNFPGYPRPLVPSRKVPIATLGGCHSDMVVGSHRCTSYALYAALVSV